LFFFFFFSSRRRHTRSDRDWSSDVCSSDLSFWSGRIVNFISFCASPSSCGPCLERPRPSWGSHASCQKSRPNQPRTSGLCLLEQIGRASCRERVKNSEGAVGIKKR